MNLYEVNIFFQCACIVLLILVCLLLIRRARAGLNSWTGIGLSFSVVFYLMIEHPFVQQTAFLFYLTVTAAINIPVLFFLLTKAIFDDHFKPSFAITLWFAIQTLLHAPVYLRDVVDLRHSVLQVITIVAEITSIGFVLAGLYTAIRTRQGDLIESRLHFRSIFVIVTAALIGVTLVVESIPVSTELAGWLQLLQRSSILVLTLSFLLNSFEIRSGFFFKQKPKDKSVPAADDSHLRQALERLITEQKIYKKEGLTIRELAAIMNEQEYRLRRLINGEMGFRNFNDFLNQYRVNEACEILTNPSYNRKTVLEIAYELGYQSIGPFNKAFKDLKNSTPTAFRKASQA